MGINTLDWVTDCLHRRKELGVLEIMATSPSLTAADGGTATMGWWGRLRRHRVCGGDLEVVCANAHMGMGIGMGVGVGVGVGMCGQACMYVDGGADGACRNGLRADGACYHRADNWRWWVGWLLLSLAAVGGGHVMAVVDVGDGVIVHRHRCH